MAKNHRRKTIKVLPSEPQQMRGRESARAYKALRSAELTKARQLIANQFNEAVIYDREIRRRRPVTHKSEPAQVSSGRLPSMSQVYKARLPAQVRNEFRDNIRAVVCASRKTRREVIFALQKAGKGGAKNKKARWTEQSRIQCR